MIKNLQSLRILFTLLVATAHLDYIWEILGIMPAMFALTHVSVDGFIVVSAFLIPYTHALRPRSPFEFFMRRFLRLAPFYWFMTYLVAALALLAPSLFQHTHVTPETLLKSLFFIPYEKQPGIIEPIVFVGWTMNLFVFYMLIHAISLWLFKGRAWIATAIFFSALVAAGFLFKPKDVLFSFYTMPRLFAFATGTLLAGWWMSVRDTITPETRPAWFAPVLLTASAVLLVLITLRDYLFPFIDPGLIGPVLGALLIAAAISLDKAGVTHGGPLRDRIAEASFTIYLTHFFVTQATVKIVQHFQLTGPLILWPLVAVTFIGVILVGLTAHRFIEQPLDRLVGKLWNQIRAPRNMGNHVGERS